MSHDVGEDVHGRGGAGVRDRVASCARSPPSWCGRRPPWRPSWPSLPPSCGDLPQKISPAEPPFTSGSNSRGRAALRPRPERLERREFGGDRRAALRDEGDESIPPRVVAQRRPPAGRDALHAREVGELQLPRALRRILPREAGRAGEVRRGPAAAALHRDVRARGRTGETAAREEGGARLFLGIERLRHAGASAEE